MRRWGLGLMAVLMAAGCSKRPDDMPGPDLEWFADLKEGCPDLRGTYTFKHSRGQGEAQRFLGMAMERAMERTPEYHSAWSIDAIDDQKIALSSWADAQDTHKAFVTWRKNEPYQYALWSQSLVSRPAPGGRVLEHDPSIERKSPPFLFLQRQAEINGIHYECEKGWVVFDGSTDTYDLRMAQVRMTRAKDGGLIAVARYTVKQSFSIWCGDGCKPNIDLGEGEREYWWHAAPAPKATNTPIDWQAWIDDDERPQKDREKYYDGMFTPYYTQKERDAELEEKKRAERVARGEPAELVVDDSQIIEPIDASLVQDNSPSDDQQFVAKPASKFVLGMCAPLQQMVNQALDAGMKPVARCTPERCMVEGVAGSSAQLSNAMRAMDQYGAKGLELVSMQQTDEGYRFSLQVDHRCGGEQRM